MPRLTAEQAATEHRHYQAVLDDPNATDDERKVAEARLAERDAQSNGHHRAARVNRWAHVDLVALIREKQVLADRSNGTCVGPHPAKHSSASGTCLVVWPGEGRWWCSSCNGHGDVPGWLADRDGIPYREACDRLRQEHGESPEEKRWNGLLGPRYGVRDGRLCAIETKVAGQTPVDIPLLLANFIAWTEAEVARDDGIAAPTLEFRLVGLLDDGHPLPPIGVPAERFGGLDWVSRWGMRAVVVAGQGRKDKLREAIQLLSGDAERRTIFTHLGWRRFDDGYSYLHAGGAVGRDDVTVEADAGLTRYALPTGPIDGDALRAAVRASLGILDVGPRRVTVPLYAGVWLAPLSFVLTPTFCLWLYGRTGGLKSTLSALATSHFGTFTFDTPPITWSATANRVERDLALARDSLLWLDDVMPGTTLTSQREMTDKVQKVLHAVGDRMGRGRLRSDTSARPSYVPAAFLLSTAEVLPSGESTVARCYPVRLADGDVDRATLTACQAVAAQYPLAMVGFLRWLRPRLDELHRDLPRHRDQLRAKAYAEGEHLRQPEQVATLSAAFDQFCQFAAEVGALAPDEARRLNREVWETLLRGAAENAALVGQERPAVKFLDALRTLVAMKRAYLCSTLVDDGAPGDGYVWGWETRYVRNSEGDMDPVSYHQAGASKLGWVDMEHVYLIGEAAHHAVSRFLIEQGGVFPIGVRVLYDHLKQAGAVIPSADKTTQVLEVNGHHHRVLKVPRAKFEGAMSEIGVPGVPGVGAVEGVAGNGEKMPV